MVSTSVMATIGCIAAIPSFRLKSVVRMVVTTAEATLTVDVLEVTPPTLVTIVITTPSTTAMVVILQVMVTSVTMVRVPTDVRRLVAMFIANVAHEIIR